MLSRVQLFVAPWTVARQAPLSVEFSQQEDWSGLPFPPPGESSPPRDERVLPCLLHFRQILYQLSHRGNQPLGKVSTTQGLAIVSNSNACMCYT